MSTSRAAARDVFFYLQPGTSAKTIGRGSINPSMYHGWGITLRKNEGECFITCSKVERQMKAGGRRPTATFIFYQVFGTLVEA